MSEINLISKEYLNFENSVLIMLEEGHTIEQLNEAITFIQKQLA